jgi:hypothetical protein
MKEYCAAKRSKRNPDPSRRLATCPVTMPVLALSVAMICSSLGTLLMTAVGTPSLLPACRDPAECTAITLTAVAVRTDPKHCMASYGNFAGRKNNFARMNRFTWMIHCVARWDWTTATARGNVEPSSRWLPAFWAAFNGVLPLPATRPRVSLPPGLPHT